MPVNLNYLLNNNMKLIIALYIALCFSTSVYALDKSKYDTVVTVKGMVCSSCAIGVKKIFKKHYLVKKLYMDTKTQKLYLDHVRDDKVIKSVEINKMVEDSGYEVYSIEYKKL